MKKEQPAAPPEDIPAWFMTYSDVITLLMTFFILLLTFSTTEPDRFERIQRNIFAGGNGAGIAGAPMDGPENESFVERYRPRAARMAMVGSEMPPYEISKKSAGNGLKGLSEEEAAQNTMTTNQFTIPATQVFDPQKNLTTKAAKLAAMMARPLSRLPVHLSVQCSEKALFPDVTKFAIHMFEAEGVRPGQVAVGFSSDVPAGSFRFSIERYNK